MGNALRGRIPVAEGGVKVYDIDCEVIKAPSAALIVVADGGVDKYEEDNSSVSDRCLVNLLVPGNYFCRSAR
jgi:hypothetical protein